jgi:hypothetical protein
VKNPFASITWSRFNGSSAFRAELSAFVVPLSRRNGRLAPRNQAQASTASRERQALARAPRRCPQMNSRFTDLDLVAADTPVFGDLSTTKLRIKDWERPRV